MRLIVAAGLVCAGLVGLLATPSVACHTVGHDCKITISFSASLDPFFARVREAAQTEARKLQTPTLQFLDPGRDQVSAILNLVREQRNTQRELFNLLIVGAIDSYTMAPAIESLNAAGIPIVTVRERVVGGQVDVHVGSDSVAGGRLAAQFIGKQLSGKGTVLMLQGSSSLTAQDRGKGFIDGLGGFPGIKLITREAAFYDRNAASAITALAFQKERIDAVFAQDDDMALGAIRAIKKLQPQPKVIVVGFGGIPDAVNAVKSGQLTATISENPVEMGRLAVRAAVDILLKKKVPAFISVPLEVVSSTR